MHELSIALRIVEIVEEEAVKKGATKVDAVHLRLGSLAGVAPDALLFSYGLACEGTAAEGSRLVLLEGEATDLEIVALEVA
jgi:hydrogenase nickel incorporation protein HypA/HybF